MAIFGQFELLQNLGSGSMAELFRGRHLYKPELGVLVIKRVRPEFRYDTNLMARFIEGAQLVVDQEHSNIARVFDAGVMVGRIYVALEHIHGKDVRHIQHQFRTTQRALPIPLAIFVMSEVCKGLEFIHAARDASTGEPLELAHCDVSTQNIMVSFEGQVKLINLEGAWFRAKGWAPTKGKCSYMSPEQARGDPVDPRADVFSAGIVLWEISTGKHLFEGTDEEIRQKVERAEITSPSEANRLVPKDLEAIILRALQRAPAARFQTAAEMRAALDDFSRKSRLSFSAGQLAGWMKMTFGDEAKPLVLPPPKHASARSQPQRSTPAPPPQPATTPQPQPVPVAKLQPQPVPVAKLQPQPSPAAPAPQPPPPAASLQPPAVPESADDWSDVGAELVDDDATRIDPTSQMLAEVELEERDSSDVVLATAPASQPEASQPEARQPEARQPEARQPEASQPEAQPAPPAASTVSEGDPAPKPRDDGEREAADVARLDQAMKERRLLDRKVQTDQVPTVKASLVLGEDADLPAGAAAPPANTQAPAGEERGAVDERAAGVLDEVMKSRRKLAQRLSGDAKVHLRFERQGAPVAFEESRSPWVALLLVVGALLAIGLALLAFMLSASDEEDPLSEPVTQVLHRDVAPRGSGDVGAR